MKKIASVILIAVGIFEVIYCLFVLPQMNRNLAVAGVKEAETGTPWGALAIGILLVGGGLVLRDPKPRGRADTGSDRSSSSRLYVSVRDPPSK